jgi:hypothetical protein
MHQLRFKASPQADLDGRLSIAWTSEKSNEKERTRVYCQNLNTSKLPAAEV